jgi:hypothetical protein
MYLKKLTLFLTCCFLHVSLYAQETPSTPSQPPNTDQRIPYNSINVGIISALLNIVSFNYMRLLTSQQALLIEGEFKSPVKGSLDSSDEPSKRFGIGIGYRHFFKKPQDSAFWGVHANYLFATNISINDKLSYADHVDKYSLTLNIGRRWCWNTGFNFTIRFGLGYAKTIFSSNRDVKASEDAFRLNQFANDYPIAADGELSLGVVF